MILKTQMTNFVLTSIKLTEMARIKIEKNLSRNNLPQKEKFHQRKNATNTMNSG